MSSAPYQPAVRLARRSFSRGGGTSLAGEACNAAVVLDFSKYMNRIIEIDWDGKKRAGAARLRERRPSQ